MLTAEDIQEVLIRFKQLEAKRQSKERSDGRNGSSMLLLGQHIPKDQLFWFKNPTADEFDKDNLNKPMYQCMVVKRQGDKVMLKLTEEERKICQIQELMQPFFEASIDNTLDYSVLASKGLPDMVDIDELNHATLLQNLHARYNKNEIYTYVGPIILAVNPFKSLDSVLYSQEQMDMYKSIIKSKQPYEDKKNMPPHIWTITALAYRQMMELKTKQAIVISGESGSGKTENAKRAMKFLTILGESGKSSSLINQVPIEQKILDTNPVLESFGNAKTERNDNSSRFGKYVLLYFSQSQGQILGARVKNYLLEKSRVIGPAPKERNYHIFYHLLRGGSEKLLLDLGLMDPETKRRFDIQDFNYLNSGSDVDQKVINDKELYLTLEDQFRNLGFTDLEISAVWRVTAAVLHVGEVRFEDSTYDENGKPCTVVNMDKMNKVAKLLGIDKPMDLVTEIVNKSGIPGQTTRAPLKLAECYDSRDSFAKCLYDNLFNWLVERMNITILPGNEGTEAFKKDSKTIGLLDIFGFENFNENNFEQMCINYVNEKLHKLYISAIFDAEKFELKNEGLADKVSSLKYPDLTSLDVIKLLDEKSSMGGGGGPGAKVGAKPAAGVSKIGLFNIVNDYSTQKPRQTWQALIKKFDDMHKATAVFSSIQLPDKSLTDKFKVRHSAKDVIYTVKTFIERNVDDISQSLETCMISKTDSIVSMIFQVKVQNPAHEHNGMMMQQSAKDQLQKVNNKKTIWSKFSNQMQDLMIELAEPLFELNKSVEEVKDASKPPGGQPPPGGVQPCENCQLHFIRCIKPNEYKRSDYFVHALTLQQMTYMGVLESVDLKQKNFPYRKHFEEFYARYELLSPQYSQCRYENMDKSRFHFRDLSVNIVKDTLKENCKEYYALGNTKILMMLEVVALLDKAVQKVRAARDQAALEIKRAFSIYQGTLNAQRKKAIFQKQQLVLKAKYQERVKQRGHLMFIKVLQHVSRAVNKKKEEHIMVATQVFADVFRKHIFRRALARRIRVRQSIVSFFYRFSLVLRLRKIFICHMMIKMIVDRAFEQAKQRADDRATRTVQRIFRGFKAREQRMHLVIEAQKAKENLKLQKAARSVQKYLRGFTVRKRLRHMERAAQKIQAIVKMKWHRKFYQKLRGDVLTIQRCVRIFLTRRGVIKSRLASYLGQELAQYSQTQQGEKYHLRFSPEVQAMNQPYFKPAAPYSTKRIQFFTRVLDEYLITDISEVYSKGWSTQWNRLSGDCEREDFPILCMANGSTHTLAVNQKGKVYAWGWNDNGQCAKDPCISEVFTEPSSKQASIFLYKDDLRIKQIVAAQDRNFILLEESLKVITWGGNEKGQLGLGTYEDEHELKLIDFFSKQNIKVSMLAAGGDLTICSCENGEAYAWPFMRNGTTYSLPVKMPFSPKISISKVSCGWNFGFFISSQGLIYAHGRDNSEGQLGLGHNYPRDVPELIQTLKDTGERIDALECGYKHVVAKSTLGKVFVWGWGGQGQLGLGYIDSEMSPRYLPIEKNNHKERVIQIAAGYSHTLLMLENRELQWFGTCGHLSSGVTKPSQVKLSEHIPELFPESTGAVTLNSPQQVDFAVVKITSSWSRSLSLTNILIADLRQVNAQNPWKKISTALQTIAAKWESREVLPPYIDTVAHLFNASILKNPNVTGGASQKKGTKSNVKTGGVGGSKVSNNYSRY